MRTSLLLGLGLFALPSTALAGSLSTTFSNNNIQNGNIFNMKAQTDLTVQSLVINQATGSTCNFEVYTHTSGATSSTIASSSGWSKVFSGTVSGTGTSTVTLDTPVAMTSGQTLGWYVTNSTTGCYLGYTNGTSVGRVYASNSDLIIYEGYGKAYAWSSSFSPRIWNGTVTYTTCTALDWYLDDDGDGYGDPNTTVSDCDQPSDYVSDATDCDDTDDTVYPGATELCDGQDNDCDGNQDADEVDNDTDGYVECALDADGWDGTAVTGYEDCDDTDLTVYPTATELCDGLDNDCDGSAAADEGDDDLDGYVECAVDSGGWDATAVTGYEDCNDSDDTVYPTATELCDGLDNDCDSSLDSNETDDDTDGYVECALDADGWDGTAVTGYEDCDDTDLTVYPTATELCDGQDNDCDGSLDTDEVDNDVDGYVECSEDSGGWDGGSATLYEDCDDTDATINPGASELCDGQDNDCDLALHSTEIDDDLDGYVDCTVDSGGWDGTAVTGYDDCDDTNITIYPGATELCDGLDNDCDSSLDTTESDLDGDGWVTCSEDAGGWDGTALTGGFEDCNDYDGDIWPGADEYCNGDDNDCDGTVDEGGLDAPTWYADTDGDGFGDAATSEVVCDQASGWVEDDTDCDDTLDTVYPGASEVAYDGVDQDCDAADLCDVDGDGYDYDGEFCYGDDCDDDDDTIFVDAEELWYDGIDQDCDTWSDYDKDGDGFDSASYGGEDCDDAAPDTYPGAPDEPGDGIVTDCDAADEYDADGDGFDGAEYGGTDCDDANSGINPGADEVWYDGIDDDCDGNDDDQDEDGFPVDVDCDDLDGTVAEDCGAGDSGDTGLGGEYQGGCGCKGSTIPVPASGLLAMLGVLLYRRRR